MKNEQGCLPGLMNGVYWLLVSLWFGSLIMTAVVASIIFPHMKELEPALATFVDYQGEHWMLAAGSVMKKVFFVGDVIALVAVSGIAFITFVQVFFQGLPITRPANALRSLMIVVLLVAVGYHVFVLAPRMNKNLQSFQLAAKAGEMDAADRFQAAFQADHPVARQMMSGNAMALIVLILSSAVGAGGASRYRRSDDEPQEPDDEPTDRPHRLEPPALLNG